MSYIIRRKVKSTTYIIEVTSYRNKDGKPRNKQRCLGKLDEDGVLISSKRKLPAEIKEVKRIVKRFIIKELNASARRETPTPTPCTEQQPQTPTTTTKALVPISASYIRIRSLDVNENMVNRPDSTFEIFIQDSDDNIQF